MSLKNATSTGFDTGFKSVLLYIKTSGYPDSPKLAVCILEVIHQMKKKKKNVKVWLYF